MTAEGTDTEQTTASPGVDPETGGDQAETVPESPLLSPPETDGEDEGKTFTATVREIERVPANEVPDDYPVSISTAEALAAELTVEGADEPVFLVYFETPERGPDERFRDLLGLAGDHAGDAGAMVGKTLLLTIADGYYMPVVPEESPRGNPTAVYGIFAGLVPSLVIALVGLFSPGASFIGSTEFMIAWLGGTFLLLPISLYLDAWNLRTTTGWSGTPHKWALMAAIPGLNVLAVPLYLIARENADPVI